MTRRAHPLLAPPAGWVGSGPTHLPLASRPWKQARDTGRQPSHHHMWRMMGAQRPGEWSGQGRTGQRLHEPRSQVWVERQAAVQAVQAGQRATCRLRWLQRWQRAIEAADYSDLHSGWANLRGAAVLAIQAGSIRRHSEDVCGSSMWQTVASKAGALRTCAPAVAAQQGSTTGQTAVAGHAAAAATCCSGKVARAPEEDTRMRVFFSPGGTPSTANWLKMQMPWGSTEWGS